MPEIDLQSALETNILKLGTLEMEAHADRMLIVQDPFVSGYECPACGGARKVLCDNCDGRGFNEVSGGEITAVVGIKSTRKKCSHCSGEGRIKCPECDGRGGLLIVPDSSERRPTTGTIMSVGGAVTCFERGQAVIYPSFAGHAFDLTATDLEGRDVAVCIVILRESEVLAKVKGHLELRRVKRSAAIGTAA